MLSKLVKLRNLFLFLFIFSLFMIIYSCSFVDYPNVMAVMGTIFVIVSIIFLFLFRSYQKKVRIAKDEQLRQQVREDGKK